MHTLLPDDQALDRLAQRIAPGATLLRAWPLVGGVSATVTALELALPTGGTTRLVVRQHGARDRARNPHIAADEHRLLQWLAAAGVPVPAPRYVDAVGDALGLPAVVVDFVDGTAGLPATGDPLPQLAALLAQIHTLPDAELALPFLPRVASAVAARLAAPAEHAVAAQIIGALRAAWPWPQPGRAALLHGDFWPGNTLWAGDRLRAVLDWEDATLGDPLADLANCRLELLWTAGADAMRRFTELYLAHAPISLAALPCWELYAALRPLGGMASWGLEPSTEQRMREQLQWFVVQALRALET